MVVLLSLWRQAETPMFLAALLGNLSVSLVLWYQNADNQIREWGLYLLAANITASTIGTLLWLSLSNWFARATPLRALQAFLGLTVSVLLLLPSALLLFNPEGWATSPPSQIVQVGSWAGWLTLCPAFLPALWYTARRHAWALPHLLCLAVSAIGVLLCCTLAAAGVPSWTAFQILQVACLIVGLLAIGIGWSRSRNDLADWLLQLWPIGLGILVLVLVLYSYPIHPTDPWGEIALLPGVSLLCVALAGWRRQQLWIFLGGLILNVTVSLFVGNWWKLGRLDEWWVMLVQVNILTATLTAAVWLTLWRPSLRREDWLGRSLAVPASPLFLLQLLFLLLASLLLVASAGIELVVQPATHSEQLLQIGSTLGWLSLLAAFLMLIWWSGRRVWENVPLMTLAGLALVILAASSTARFAPREGSHTWLAYHVLTFGWSGIGLGLLLLGWDRSQPRLPRSKEDAATETIPGAASDPWTLACVLAVALLVLGLALRGAGVDPGGPSWSAGAILSVSVMLAGLALWQKQEKWAFAAALCLNLAATLIVGLDAGGTRLVQVNSLVSAFAAVVWIAAARRLYPSTDAPYLSAPLLTLQVLLGVLGNLVVLVRPAIHLIASPDRLDSVIEDAGSPLGWCVLLALVPAIWHLHRWLSEAVVFLGSGLGLCLGILGACTVAARLPSHPWLGYHVLTLSWALTGITAAVWSLKPQFRQASVLCVRGFATPGAESGPAWDCRGSGRALVVHRCAWLSRFDAGTDGLDAASRKLGVPCRAGCQPHRSPPPVANTPGHASFGLGYLAPPDLHSGEQRLCPRLAPGKPPALPAKRRRDSLSGQ